MSDQPPRTIADIEALHAKFPKRMRKGRRPRIAETDFAGRLERLKRMAEDEKPFHSIRIAPSEPERSERPLDDVLSVCATEGVTLAFTRRGRLVASHQSQMIDRATETLVREHADALAAEFASRRRCDCQNSHPAIFARDETRRVRCSYCRRALRKTRLQPVT